jgi:hypothetical protein
LQHSSSSSKPHLRRNHEAAAAVQLHASVPELVLSDSAGDSNTWRSRDQVRFASIIDDHDHDHAMIACSMRMLLSPML